MQNTLSERLTRIRAGFFVGRENERERFAAFLGATAPVRFLHVLGPGGIGKSSLIRSFVRHCTDQEIPYATIDARQVEAKPMAFVAKVRAACDLPSDADVFDFLQTAGRFVIFVDSYEDLAGIEPWLFDHFFPRLGTDIRVVLGARKLTSPAWHDDPAWRALSDALHLRHFSRAESLQFLSLHGIGGKQRDEAARLSFGNPLVLSLMAQVWQSDPDVELADGLPVDSVYHLMERLLDAPPSADHVAGLQLACMMRGLSEDALTAILDVAEAAEIFRWLAELSFMRWSETGLVPHDLVREIVMRDMKVRLPTRHESLFLSCRRFLVSRLRESHAGNRQRYMEDFFYLFKNEPAFRAIFGGHLGDGLYADMGRADEYDDVLATIARTEGEKAAAIARYWLGRPETKLVMVRDDSARWIGFVLMLRFVRGIAPKTDDDPVLHAMWAYVQRHDGLRDGEVALFGRFWMTRDHYQMPGPIQVRIFQYVSEQHILTPGLAFLGCSFAHPEKWPLVLEVRNLAEAEIDGTPYGWLGYNLRETPVVAWLEHYTGQFDQSSAGAMVPPPVDPPVFALARSEFDSAVKTALRKWRQPDRLAQNPLLQSRLVLDRASADASVTERAAALRQILHRCVKNFPGVEFDERPRAVLLATYFEAGAKQVVVAQHLGLAFSTYRHHLAQALTRLCDVLWKMEMGDEAAGV